MLTSEVLKQNKALRVLLAANVAREPDDELEHFEDAPDSEDEQEMEGAEAKTATANQEAEEASAGAKGGYDPIKREPEFCGAEGHWLLLMHWRKS